MPLLGLLARAPALRAHGLDPVLQRAAGAFAARVEDGGGRRGGRRAAAGAAGGGGGAGSPAGAAGGGGLPWGWTLSRCRLHRDRLHVRSDSNAGMSTNTLWHSGHVTSSRGGSCPRDRLGTPCGAARSRGSRCAFSQAFVRGEATVFPWLRVNRWLVVAGGG